MHLHSHLHPLSPRPPSRCFTHSSEGFQGCPSRHSDSARIADRLPAMSFSHCHRSLVCHAHHPHAVILVLPRAQSGVPTLSRPLRLAHIQLPIEFGPLNTAQSFHYPPPATAHRQVGTCCHQKLICVVIQCKSCSVRHVNGHGSTNLLFPRFDCVNAQPRADLVEQRV